MSDEPKISGRYRELPREEPPRALDDAILAASRRAVKGRNRWYVPLAAAAVIVLAVAVTVHVERERPSEEVASASVEPAKEVTKAEPAPKLASKSEPQRRYVPDPAAAEAPRAPAPAAAPAPTDSRMRDEVAAKDAAARAKAEQVRGEAQLTERAAAAPASAAPAAAGARPQASAEMRRADEARRSIASSTLAKFAEQSPEQWLLGIDDLKRQGRHEEAEKQLAEFRKRYPNYRIPEAITEKFERR